VRWWTRLSVVIALAVIATWLPRTLGEAEFARANVWPLLRRWSDPPAQAQLAASPALADVLIEADRRLPADARVALLTAGDDVDTSEYIAFHRALYYLSPRPVWWVVANPDPASGRGPRWYHTALPAEADWVLGYQTSLPSATGTDLGGNSVLVWRGVGPPPAADHVWSPWAGATWPLGAAFAVLTLLAAGLGVQAGLRRLGLQASGVERLALAWVLGGLVISLGLLVGCAIGLGLQRSAWLLAGVTWVVSAWLVAARAGWPPPSRGTPGVTRSVTSVTPSVTGATAVTERPTGVTPGPTSVTRRLVAAALVAGLGLVVAYVVVLADGRPLQVWDSWVTWGMKARLIWQADAISTAVYADPTRAVTLLNYPLLLPLLEAWLYTWVGAPDDRLAGLVGVGAYAALLGLVYGVLRQRGASTLLALLGAVYLGSMWSLAGLAGLAFADVPLAAFGLLAAIALVRWLEGGPPAWLAFAALAGGGLAWTKREGAIMLVLLIAVGLVSRRGRAAAAALALGGVLIAGPWLAFVAWRGLLDWQFVRLSPAIALANLDRLPFVFGTLGHFALDPGWSLLWPLGLLALGLVAWRGPRPIDWLPLLAIAYLLALSASYLFSAFVPYQGHVLASLERLMAQVAPLVGVWLAVRWLDARPTVSASVGTPLRRPPDDDVPTGPPGSSMDRRTPALESRETALAPSRRTTRRLPPRLGTRSD
jgi:hypothetical protein